MCTCMSLTAQHHFFGRTLDHDREHTSPVVVMPRHAPVAFRRAGTLCSHPAMIGTAAVIAGFPLFYDATNEHGLSMAGLNFPGLAQYHPPQDGTDNITPFELIPWVLSQCETVQDARRLLSHLTVAAIPFSARLPMTPLHWMLDDRHESVVIESAADGLHVYDNPVRVLTNSPAFPEQMAALDDFRQSDRPLPGDYDSTPRFIRAAVVRHACASDGDERDAVPHFMHMMAAVSPPRGMVRTDSGRLHFTRYTSCCDADTGVYYVSSYLDPAVRCASMHRVQLDGRELTECPLEFFC